MWRADPVGFHRHRAGAQAPRHPRRMSAAASARRSMSTPKRPSVSGPRKRSPPGQNGPATAPRIPRRRHGRDHISDAEMALDARWAAFYGLRVKTRANLGAYLVDLRELRADLSLRAAALPASTISRPSMLRSRAFTRTPRRSMLSWPRAVRKRPISSSASSKRQHANSGRTLPASRLNNIREEVSRTRRRSS